MRYVNITRGHKLRLNINYLSHFTFYFLLPTKAFLFPALLCFLYFCDIYN